jgi:DNA invertase Pin-like site-specific DNA recombinase
VDKMKGQNVGYIRVSSVDQNTERQLDGVELDKIFTEKLSGKDTNRPELQRCLEHLREHDVLHVHSIDRLARNLKDLQTIVDEQNKKGVAVHFHKENLVFAGNASPMNTLMFQMLGAFAEFERTLIKERQREGIAAAKARGQKLGAPSKLNASQVEEIKMLVSCGNSKTTIAKQYGITTQTIYRMIA